MREAILRLIIPDNWVRDISIKYPSAIKFLECIPYGTTGGRGLIEIEGPENVPKKIVSEIKNHPSVSKVNMSFLSDGTAIGSVFLDKCVACRSLVNSDCFLVSASCVGDGSIEWRVVTGNDDSLFVLIDDLTKKGCEVELINVGRIIKKDILTTRQENIIKTAFEKGYYNYPKGIKTKKLSEMYNISPSTLSEILKRGERKIMFEHFR